MTTTPTDPARKALDIAGDALLPSKLRAHYTPGRDADVYRAADVIEALRAALEAAEGRAQELEANAAFTIAEVQSKRQAAELALATAKADTITDIASALAGRGDKKCAEFVAGMKEKGE